MSDEINKSHYGPKGTAAGAQYDPKVNQERKANNTQRIPELPHGGAVKAYTGLRGTATQQASIIAAADKAKNKKQPVKQNWTPEQIKEMESKYSVKKDELEVEADGKQEMVEGSEPLKKDPKKRWLKLKKALHHDKAFMDLEDEMGAGEQPEQPQPDAQAPTGQAADLQQELEPEQDDSAESDQGPLEAVSEGDEGREPSEEQGEDEQEGDANLSPDQQELIEALKSEGYSDQEIAYIVHGHHAPEVDPTKQAKAQATSAMSDLDLNNAQQMAELERQHAEQGMAQEREHKKRMSDLEYENAQKKHALVDQDAAHKQRMSDVEYQQAQKNDPGQMESAHKQRMLDLEYERAKRESQAGDAEGNAEADKAMKALEVEKKKLELELRREEMKMELEFKKREHELKLKIMEQQIKDQAKQKGEISGIKHEQKLKEVKNPPKKPLKKNDEEEND